MATSLGSGWRWGSDGRQAPPKITPTVEELQSRVQETLDLLSPRELSHFRVLLKTVDEGPRVSPLRLELEGGSKAGLARLLAQHYYLPAVSRVLIKVLQQLRRADLLPRWQSAEDDDRRGERGRCREPGLGAGPGSAAGMGGGVVAAGLGGGARVRGRRPGGGAEPG